VGGHVSKLQTCFTCALSGRLLSGAGGLRQSAKLAADHDATAERGLRGTVERLRLERCGGGRDRRGAVGERAARRILIVVGRSVRERKRAAGRGGRGCFGGLWVIGGRRPLRTSVGPGRRAG